ncbi:hypothetical protein F5888DRAFT_1800259 [Russula emetica]|nr:hypothetical protein F5888DRAFT_1800259 [Russula emetica]
MSFPHLFSLSHELFIEIFSNLCPFDIYACRRTCRQLNELIAVGERRATVGQVLPTRIMMQDSDQFSVPTNSGDTSEGYQDVRGEALLKRRWMSDDFATEPPSSAVSFSSTGETLLRPELDIKSSHITLPPESTALAPSSFPSRLGPSILMDSGSEADVDLITFDMLPDDVILEIFDFYVDEDESFERFEKRRIEEWIKLAHVCRRWRGVVFQSPRRLNLRLLCTSRTRMRDTLDIWPPLGLTIYYSPFIHYSNGKPPVVDNIIAALEHNDRVCQIGLGYLSSSQMGYVTDSAAMQKPFPELTDLRLNLYDRPERIFPDSFLGGTAPRLRSLESNGVTFPGLPKLLLSTTHLVDLHLSDIPLSGYIPPEAMATSLSALTSLESLRLSFSFHPEPRPALESRRLPPPPLTRSILPSLTWISFKGTSEYLEVILARIDAPRLNELYITFFNQIILDTPQLFQFINRSPTLKALEKGCIASNSTDISVKMSPRTSYCDKLIVTIPYTASGWRLQVLVCTSSLPPVSTLEDLYIEVDLYWWQDDVENTLWLELLHPFVAVKNLYLREEFVPRIAPALQELVGERTTEVLPTLENIFLEGFQALGSLHEGIEKFVAARRLTSHPVAVSRWDGW